MRTSRALMLVLCGFLVSIVCGSVVPQVEAAQARRDAEGLRAATSHDVDEVRHMLRLADRMLQRIESAWLERSPSQRLSGRLGLRIEQQRELLAQLQGDLARTDEQALGAPGATRLFHDFYELRQNARALVEELEKLTWVSRRALEKELIFETELQELRVQLRRAQWRALQHHARSRPLAASAHERSSPSESAMLRAFNGLRRELDRIDALRDPERRLASLDRLRSLRGQLETLETSGPRLSPPMGPSTPATPAQSFITADVAVPSGTGSIIGTVTEEGTGTELESIHLELFDASGGWLAATGTNAAGVYEFTGLGTGDYYVKTWDNAPHVDEVWPDVYCPAFCDPLGGSPIGVADGAVTSGIDFALALGGVISGRVTDSSDGTGIDLDDVQILNASGDAVSFANPDPDGYYASQGLPPGNYFVWAKTIGGEHISEVYDNVVCHFWTQCGPADIVAGTPVAVTAGTTTSGIDLALDPAGVLVGTFTDELTSDPIAGAGVDIYDAAGNHVAGSWWSDPAGEYMAEWPLPAGSYYLTTWNHTGHLDELYSGFDCILGDCVPTDGTPVVMTAGVVTQIDFALTPGASFSGTVRDEADSSPITNGLVSVYDSSGDWLGDAWIESDGTYFFGGMTAGTYYAHTVTWSDYLDELYDDKPCWSSCDPLDGTGIMVPAGGDLTGIDFDLVLGGSFSGEVRAAADNSPIADGLVSIYDSSGEWVQDSYLDLSGDYLASGLPPGTYYARSVNWDGFLDELYDDNPCWDGCVETTGDPIVVMSGVDTPGIDFYLETGGSISGQVSAAGSGAAISDGSVILYDDHGWWYDRAWLEPDGTYLFEGLVPGTYYATTSTNEGHLDELYDDILCASGVCDPKSGTGILVPAGTEVPNIDFVLDLGGSIVGTVRDASDASVLPGVEVHVYDQRGWEVTVAYSDGAGQYAAGGLVTGSYYAVTNNWQGYVDEIHADVACVLDWPESCLRGGAAIAVTVGVSTSGIDFDLLPGGTIAGTVTEDGSGTPLEDIGVFVFDETGREVAYNRAYTDAAGAFTVSGLPTGQYYAMTENRGGAHIDELYDNLPAPGSEFYGAVHLGTQISVTAPLETSGTDFSLVQGGTVSGLITDATSGLPLAYAYVGFFDAAGTRLSYTYAESDGSYTSPGLPSGTYFARAAHWDGFAQQLFDGFPCEPRCDSEAGTPISVTVGADTGGIDFALELLAAGGGGSGSISGRVTAAGSNDPLEDVDVDIYDQDGSYVTYGWTDQNGEYTATGLPTGDYYARTWNSDGYLDELYDDIDCWAGCDETTGTAVPVIDGADTSGIDFALLAGGRISGTVTDPAGAPLVNTYIDLYDSSGTYVDYDGTGAAGGYEIDGLPAGTYYAVTDFSAWPRLSYLDELWNDRPCFFGDCEPTSGDAITVALGSSTTGVDFMLAPGGSIEGRVFDVASGLPLAGNTIEVHDSGGDYLRRTWTDATGYYSLGGLPTGAYYLRAWNWDGFLNEVYDDVACPLSSCEVTTGNAISVTAGSTTSGKDFGLARGGAILGEVRDAASNLPAVGAGVRIYDSSGEQVTRVWIDGGGRYAGEGLPTGTYYAMAYGSHHLAEAYDGYPCATGCNVTEATPIQISPGTLLVTGKDFSLDMGAIVVGTVMDAATGKPVTSGQVELHDSAGVWVASPWLDGAGRYYASGLLPAAMCARTDNFAGLMNKRYDDLSCVGSCDPEKGTPFGLSLGARTSGIDFDLYAPGADPDIVLEAERLDSGVTVAGCDRVTVGPDLGVTTTDPVRIVGKEIVVTNGFFTDGGVDLTFDADPTLTCP